MSNTKLSIVDLNTQQREDYDFYKKLGYTDDQCLTLAYYVFASAYGTECEIIEAMLKAHKKHKKVPFSKFFAENYKEITQQIRDEGEKRRKER